MKRLSALVATALLAGCAALPKDADGTLDRVRRDHVFRVGIIADGGEVPSAAAGDFLRRLAAATGAEPQLAQGASEPLLLKLKDGQLDLVVGTVAPDSPWITDVAILKPIAETIAPQHLVLTPIARNGENRWIMLVEREAQAARAGSGA